MASINSIEDQLNTPRGSQKATVKQTVGITDIYITYSRPSVKGRAYASKGNNKAAIKYLTKALKLAPVKVNKDRVQANIDRLKKRRSNAITSIL